jgi:hypothetical protein
MEVPRERVEGNLAVALALVPPLGTMRLRRR